jgi:uncharacterized protein YciI
MNHYLLITTRSDQFDTNDIQGHYDHLDRLKSAGQLELYGPFTDATGGAYLIKASSLEEATLIGNSDQLIKNGSSTLAIKEWTLR